MLLGGAERLVVDAALGLQQLGHEVDIYTSHHDPNHCFEETRDGALSITFPLFMQSTKGLLITRDSPRSSHKASVSASI